METLRAYLNAMTPAQQHRFAARAGTSVSYLRKAICVRSKMGPRLCLAIEKASRREVRAEALRPDLNWDYLRNHAA
jgi:DNA-binding transcriptional regulator YdaS (Cro superfamily)